MEGYSDEDVSRYNRADTGDPTRFLEQFKAIDSRISPETQNFLKERGISALTSPAVRSRRRAAPVRKTAPTQMSEKERNDRFIGESFKNFPQNRLTRRISTRVAKLSMVCSKARMSCLPKYRNWNSPRRRF